MIIYPFFTFNFIASLFPLFLLASLANGVGNHYIYAHEVNVPIIVLFSPLRTALMNPAQLLALAESFTAKTRATTPSPSHPPGSTTEYATVATGPTSGRPGSAR